MKFVTGHGQLPPTQLEDVMAAFYEGRYDVLLEASIVVCSASTSRPPMP